ncbi:hypothetical protein [Cytobacillus sp. SAFR-174]|uniref:hypothetical protein n=1 Tax=Cytobacillus sp. SAFR-174 TaxID=3436868 RepID=UPI003F814339
MEEFFAVLEFVKNNAVLKVLITFLFASPLYPILKKVTHVFFLSDIEKNFMSNQDRIKMNFLTFFTFMLIFEIYFVLFGFLLSKYILLGLNNGAFVYLAFLIIIIHLILTIYLIYRVTSKKILSRKHENLLSSSFLVSSFLFYLLIILSIKTTNINTEDFIAIVGTPLFSFLLLYLLVIKNPIKSQYKFTLIPTGKMENVQLFHLFNITNNIMLLSKTSNFHDTDKYYIFDKESGLWYKYVRNRDE